MSEQPTDQPAAAPAGAFPAEVLAELVPVIMLLSALAAVHLENRRRARRRRLAQQVGALAGLMNLLSDPAKLDQALRNAGIEPPRCLNCGRTPSEHPPLDPSGRVACLPPPPPAT